MTSKGITPVIATVMLLTISIATTASAYTFINTLQEDAQESFEEDLRQEQLETQSNMNIEYVYNGTDGYMLTTVRNTGSIPLNFKQSGEKSVLMYIDFSAVGDGTGWRFEDEDLEDEETVRLSSQGTVTLNSTEKYPSEDDDDVWIELNGPYSTSSTHVCSNTGRPSC